jgi:hypothetical protein
MKKIGSLFMVSVLALAGLGISYAGFTDAISVYGTVDTATVDIELETWFSGTWVWKVYGGTYQGDEIYVDYAWVGEQLTADEILALSEFAGATTAIPISSSFAAAGGDYDVVMTYDNLFPCIDFEADFIVHYVGSIPAKINVAEIFSDTGDLYPGSQLNFLDWLWAYHLIPGNEAYGAWVEAYRCFPIFDTDEVTIIGWNIDEAQPVDVGYQLHNCNYVYVKLVIHLPQDNLLQGLTGTFGGNIGVIQWNDGCYIG